MYSLLVCIISIIVVSKSTMITEETNLKCQWTVGCFLALAEQEIDELNYLAAVHEKEKFKKLCQHRFAFTSCRIQTEKTCYLETLHQPMLNFFNEYYSLCEEYQQEWEKEDAVTVLRNGDSSCKEVVACLKNMSETYHIPIGIYHAMDRGDFGHKDICFHSVEFNTCWDKKTDSCEKKSMDNWLNKTHHFFHSHCVKNVTLMDEATIQTYKNYQCSRGRCWDYLSNVHLIDLENLHFSNDTLKKNEICRKIQDYRNCDNQYRDSGCFYEPTNEQNSMKEILNVVFCTEEERIAAEKADDVFVSNCTGLIECLNHIAESERNMLEYLSDIYNKTKYDKMCPNTEQEGMRGCYEPYQKTCYFHTLNQAVDLLTSTLLQMCAYIDKNWDRKDPVSYLKKEDFIQCSEIFKCMKQLAATENIAVGYVDLYMDKTKHINFCSKWDKVQNCMKQSSNETCKIKFVNQWTVDWSYMFKEYCEEGEFTSKHDVAPIMEAINSSVCPNEPCWQMINNINLTQFENFQFASNQSLKAELCELQGRYHRCTRNKMYCENYVTGEQRTKRKLLEGLFCSVNHTAELACTSLRQCYSQFSLVKDILAGQYGSLQNKVSYDTICPIQSNTYQCYFDSESDCYDTYDVYSFETLRLVHKYVCSDEGKQAIALLPRSKCSNDSNMFNNAMEEYFSCPLIGKPKRKFASIECPDAVHEHMEKCLRLAFKKRCGEEFATFHWNLWAIKYRNINYDCVPPPDMD